MGTVKCSKQFNRETMTSKYFLNTFLKLVPIQLQINQTHAGSLLLSWELHKSSVSWQGKQATSSAFFFFFPERSYLFVALEMYVNTVMCQSFPLNKILQPTTPTPQVLSSFHFHYS